MLQNRIVFLIVASFLIGGGLTARLFTISVLQHDKYVALAENRQDVIRDILPRRGEIFAQDAASGQPDLVAQGVERFAISATPANVTEKEAMAHLLAGFTGVNEQDLLTTFKKNGEYMPPIKHGLSRAEVEQLTGLVNTMERQANPSWQDAQVNFDISQGDILDLADGVFLIREYQRFYPEGSLLSQVLGFVNTRGIGQYGFEGEYDSELSGHSGQVTFEQDSLGTLLAKKSTVQGQDGNSYELTIDRNVQFVVERELAAEVKDSEATGGSVVILDPKTGEIIAMANTPTFDPNAYQDVPEDQLSVFSNPTISGSWEPGSIFKDLVMAAAIDQGVVTPDTTNTFPESVTVEGHVIETALRRAYGTETMTQVLANSDNVAMVWVANKLGNQAMHDYLQKFGLGNFTGVDLSGEISGSLKPASAWQDIDRATISFGQGIAVTPLQIATAYAALANDGRMVKPHIVKAIIRPDGTREEVKPVLGAQVVKPETAQELKDMMVATVVSSHNRAGTEGYEIGGKTGTAQIPDPVNGGYLPDAYNHSFVGIGPANDPKYVMLVKIDHPNLQKVGLYAEGTAVPLFGRISSFLLNYYQIPPTNR